MNAIEKPWVSQKKWIVGLLGVPVLVGAWWAFRPEKLFVNQKVNEAGPLVAGSEPQPIYTGKLEGRAHSTSGRATVYESAEGQRYLRLSDFTTSNGPDVHVLLARAEDKALDQEIVTSNLESVELGPLKGNQGDQNYALPENADFDHYRAVVIYCERFHAIFGVAKLEKF